MIFSTDMETFLNPVRFATIRILQYLSFERLCIYGMLKIKLDFSSVANWMKYHAVSSFAKYGSHFVSEQAIKQLSEIVSDLQHYAHRKTHNFCFLSQKTFFRCFYMKENHRLHTPKLTLCRPRSDYPERHFLRRIALFKLK